MSAEARAAKAEGSPSRKNLEEERFLDTLIIFILLVFTMKNRTKYDFYKVVTENNQSLGLMGNPNILTFPEGKWVHEPNPQSSDDHEGGIWCTDTLGKARAYVRYMKRKHGKPVKIFGCEIGNVLYRTSVRVKTDKVRLVEQIPFS